MFVKMPEELREPMGGELMEALERGAKTIPIQLETHLFILPNNQDLFLI